ncbi:MAG TPA: UMP kinase, partial [Gammaproteobacteria bacterium]|nr:UMP kinase [Gammaproteobacteria bacterium]
YSAGAAITALENGRVAILAGGTGNPYFTTDTTAALRALEINASTLVKATNVDGIYNSDPAKDPAASRYQEIDYDTAIVKDLKVMDGTAFALCRSNNMPIRVVNLNTRGNLQRVVEGDAVGTLVIKGGEQDA